MAREGQRGCRCRCSAAASVMEFVVRRPQFTTCIVVVLPCREKRNQHFRAFSCLAFPASSLPVPAHAYVYIWCVCCCVLCRPHVSSTSTLFVSVSTFIAHGGGRRRGRSGGRPATHARRGRFDATGGSRLVALARLAWPSVATAHASSLARR